MKCLLRELEAYAEKNKIPIVLENTRQILKLLLISYSPKNILEIGTAIGYSSIFMADVLEGKVNIDTIEINKNMVDKAWENVNKADFQKNIRIIEGDAGEVVPMLTKEYDFIFLDAAKSKYIELLPYCVWLLSKEGIIVADNVLYKGMTEGDEFVRHKQRTAVVGLRRFIRELENHPQIKTVVLDIGDGVTVSVKIYP